MKILVTGGAGYIGSTTCFALADAGYTPIILDSLVIGRREFTKNFAFYEGDIANEILLAKILKEHPEIKHCIHFAARISVPESVSEPYLYYTENVAKSVMLFNNLRHLGVDKIIFSSSASLYDSTNQIEVDEQSAIKPTSPYSRTKHAMEMVLEDFANADYFRAVALRYFNPIGADIHMRSGPFLFISTALLNKLLNVAQGIDSTFFLTGTDWQTRDGTGIRDYIHVWDLAQAHVQAVKLFDSIFADSKYQIINLGTGLGTTVKEFVSAFTEVLGKEIPIEYTSPRPGDIAGVYANCQKAAQILDWKTKLDIKHAIADTLNWANNNRKKILGF
ncbi:MAG: UDP-glucose 4-epimerase GalE [Turicibacter sp.]|nr:UDP-glucose 4-epimerase GalE [Turicibacter sp.]